jgi:hypothetical protein
MPQTHIFDHGVFSFFTRSLLVSFFHVYNRPLLSNSLIRRLDLDEVRRAPEDEALAPRNIEPI